MVECNIHDCGNEYPVVGDYLQDDDGDLWQVVEIHTCIYTLDESNFVHGKVVRHRARFRPPDVTPFNAGLEFV